MLRCMLLSSAQNRLSDKRKTLHRQSDNAFHCLRCSFRSDSATVFNQHVAIKHGPGQLSASSNTNHKKIRAVSAVGNVVANNSVQSNEDSVAEDSDTHNSESAGHDGMAVDPNISEGTKEEAAAKHVAPSVAPSSPSLESLVQLKAETDKYDGRVVNLSVARTEEETAIQDAMSSYSSSPSLTSRAHLSQDTIADDSETEEYDAMITNPSFSQGFADEAGTEDHPSASLSSIASPGAAKVTNIHPSHLLTARFAYPYVRPPQFRSVQQAQAVDILLERKINALIIMKPGGGRKLILFGPIFVEHGGVFVNAPLPGTRQCLHKLQAYPLLWCHRAILSINCRAKLVRSAYRIPPGTVKLSIFIKYGLLFCLWNSPESANFLRRHKLLLN